MANSRASARRWWVLTAALVLLLGTLGWRPELLILVAPNLKVTSAYCSRWRAVTDERQMLDQAAQAAAIRQASRLTARDGALEQWQTPVGAFWIPKGSEGTLATLLAQQRARIYGPVSPGEVIIDCGAHVGTFARAALEAGAARVITVEPAPEALACLRRNLAPEIAAGRVTVVPKGIWDKDGELTFYQNGNGDAADSFVNHDGTSKPVIVPVTTLDTIATELGLTRLDLVKADVKGATERALQGGQTILARLKPRLALATEEPPEDPARLSAVVARLLPAHQARCGHCMVLENEIRTDVMFYAPARH